MDNNSTLTNEHREEPGLTWAPTHGLVSIGHKASGHRLATQKNDAIASCNKLQTKLQILDQTKSWHIKSALPHGELRVLGVAVRSPVTRSECIAQRGKDNILKPLQLLLYLIFAGILRCSQRVAAVIGSISPSPVHNTKQIP